MAVIKIALSRQLRVKNKTRLTTTNSNKTSPAGKNAAFNVAKPTNSNHAPQETVTEVFPPPLLILRLNIKSKTKQKGKDGVCLTCTKG